MQADFPAKLVRVEAVSNVVSESTPGYVLLPE